MRFLYQTGKNAAKINALFLDATTGQTRKKAYLISFYGTDDTEKRKRRRKFGFAYKDFTKGKTFWGL